mmetsp:Transcript_27728/g.66022  ORF Transcript_27728/g.66022 Transcript_27728/m.66022 type:complete len:460 (-) Transcript_27728:132-1511(-)
MGATRRPLIASARYALVLLAITLATMEVGAQYPGGRQQVPQQAYGGQRGDYDYDDYIQPQGQQGQQQYGGQQQRWPGEYDDRQQPQGGGGQYYEDDVYYEQPVYQQPAFPPPPPQQPKRSAQQSHDLDDATAYQEKGLNMMRNGRLKEAMVLFDQCLRTQLNTLGPEHPFVAQTMDLMGVLLLKNGKPREAFEVFEKCTWIYERRHGGTPPPLDDPTVIDWALTVMHMGQAKELEAESVVVREDGGGKEGVLDPTVDRLTREAMREYDRSHEIFSTVEVEIPDLDLANILHCKGSVYNIRQEFREAFVNLRLALKDKITILGEDDPSVAWTKNNMGNALRGMGKIDAAMEMYHDALETAMKHFGPNHPEVAHIHWNLALAIQSQAEEIAAKREAHWRNNWFFRIFLGTKRWAHEGREFMHMAKHLQQAFEVYQEKLGMDHISTIRAHEAAQALEKLRRE